MTVEIRNSALIGSGAILLWSTLTADGGQYVI